MVHRFSSMYRNWERDGEIQYTSEHTIGSLITSNFHSLSNFTSLSSFNSLLALLETYPPKRDDDQSTLN